MTNKKEDLKTHYLETHINLLSHILFGIIYKLTDDGKQYKNNDNTIDIDKKLDEIKKISDKIKKNINEINDILNKDEENLKTFYNEIMFSQ